MVYGVSVSASSFRAQRGALLKKHPNPHKVKAAKAGKAAKLLPGHWQGTNLVDIPVEPLDSTFVRSSYKVWESEYLHAEDDESSPCQ